jgi:hypothetical protein
MEQAREAVARLLKFEPTLRISNVDRLFPLRRPEHAKLLAEGLRKAGLPEN